MVDTIFVGRACGKAILLGEHFVVHGAPALAIPLRGLVTVVSIEVRPDTAGLVMDTDPAVVSAASEAVRLLADRFGLDGDSLTVRVESSVPLGCGLGSSAAFAVAIVRAFQRIVAHPGTCQLDVELTNATALDLERLAHGNPSGVDNTVVCYERPLVFRRDQPPQFIEGGSPLAFLVADSGIRYSTARAVAAVGEFANGNPVVFREILNQVEGVVRLGMAAYLRADGTELGEVMTANHELLQKVGVSSTLLDRLVRAALGAGAWGAKLTGAGVGGSILAVLPPENIQVVTKALVDAGALRVLNA